VDSPPIDTFQDDIYESLKEENIRKVLGMKDEDETPMEAYKCDNPNCGIIHYRPTLTKP